jgi:hypothetical protein
VFTRDVRVEGFSTADWRKLGAVWRPAQAPPSRGGVIAVTTGQRLRKLLSTRRGRLDPRAEPWPAPLGEVAARHGARWALHVHAGALHEVAERFGRRLRPEHEAIDQLLLLLGAVRELEQEGALLAWPHRVASWPIPHPALVTRAFDLFCPDGRAVLLGVFEGGELATCLAARRRGSGFDLLLGPDAFRPEMGLLSGDWTRDYRHLARAAERRLGPLAVGCFGELRSLQRLAAPAAPPGAWAAATASRDVVLAPVSPVLAVPFAVDAGRATLAAARGFVRAIRSSTWLGSDALLESVTARVGQVGRLGPDLRSVLGFDPLALLGQLLARDPDAR